MNNLIEIQKELVVLEKISHIKKIKKMNKWWIQDLIKQNKMRKNLSVYPLEKIMKIEILVTK